ncbi:MAG TPA: hypothetical protein VFE96_06860 [Candidatus Bathyarchaeia archaeon]|nr:hypothetical protein [Candidatus Bathyarchaeia archaeon]
MALGIVLVSLTFFPGYLDVLPTLPGPLHAIGVVSWFAVALSLLAAYPLITIGGVVAVIGYYLESDASSSLR